MKFVIITVFTLFFFASTLSLTSVNVSPRKYAMKMSFGGIFSPKPKAIEKVNIKCSVMGAPAGNEKFFLAEVGQQLENVAIENGVEIKYQCKKGECSTCLVNVDSKWVKACQTVIPSVRASSSFFRNPILYGFNSSAQVKKGETLNIVVKAVIKKDENEKKAAFFSPKSLVDGFNNNVLGMVGFGKGTITLRRT